MIAIPKMCQPKSVPTFPITLSHALLARVFGSVSPLVVLPAASLNLISTRGAATPTPASASPVCTMVKVCPFSRSFLKRFSIFFTTDSSVKKLRRQVVDDRDAILANLVRQVRRGRVVLTGQDRVVVEADVR